MRVYTEIQNEFRKIPALTFVKPTQYENLLPFFLAKTELSYHSIFEKKLEVKHSIVWRKTFQRNSEFEISGSAISEKISDVKTLPLRDQLTAAALG